MELLAVFPNGTKHVIVEGDTLYIREGGPFFGGRLWDDRLVEIDANQPIALLPLLEADRDTYEPGVLSRLPLRGILVTALTWQTDYWPALALKWLTDDELADSAIHQAVGEIASDGDRPQPLRHAARRILRNAGLPRYP